MIRKNTLVGVLDDHTAFNEDFEIYNRRQKYVFLKVLLKVVSQKLPQKNFPPKKHS